MIVGTGILLGAAFNHLGLSGRSPRGLPWIARPVALAGADSVVDLADSPAPAAVPGGLVLRSEDRIAPPGTMASGVPPAPPTGGGPAPVGAAPARAEEAGPLRVELPRVAQLVAAGAALVVDARDAASFAAGHIPGAVNVPFDDAYRDPSRLGSLDPGDRPIVVYCSGGACESSRMLAEMLVRDFGMRPVLVFEDGFPAWESAGQPVSRGPP